MGTFRYTVVVDTETAEQADQVITNRVYHDEDYGFDYTIDLDETHALAVVRDMPDPRDDALDLIADAAGKYGDPGPEGTFDVLFETVVDVLHRTGREV